MTVEWKGPGWLTWCKDREWPVAKIFNRVTAVELRGSYATDANVAQLANFSQLQHVTVGPMEDKLKVRMAQFTAARPDVAVTAY